MITPKVELGFGSTWKTADGSITWTDVTAYVLDGSAITVRRGRQSELDEYTAGVCSFRLKHTDRRFDPSTTGGPYGSNLKPGVPVRITATYNAVTYPVFRGFVTGWPQEYDRADRVSFVPVQAVDGFRHLSGYPGASSSFVAALDDLGPSHWWRLDNGDEFVVPDHGTTKADGTTNAAVAFDGEPLDGVNPSGNFANDSYVLIDQSFVNSRGHDYTFLLNTTTADGAIFTEAGPALGTYRVYVDSAGKVSWLDVEFLTGIRSSVAVTDGETHLVVISPGNSKVYVDGVDVTEVFAPGSYDVSPDGRPFIGAFGVGESVGRYVGQLAHLALFSFSTLTGSVADDLYDAWQRWVGETADTRVGRILDAVGWPAGLRDLEAGDPLGPALTATNALAQIQDVEKTEQGRFFISRDGKARLMNRYFFVTEPTSATSQATFVDNGTALSYADISFTYDDALVTNIATGSRVDGPTVTVTDQTSIDTYRPASEDFPNLQLSSDTQVRSLMEYRVDRYKDPQLRVAGVELKPYRNLAALAPAVLGRELAERVTLARTPQDTGSAISAVGLIEAVEHHITAKTWTTRLAVSPVDTRSYAVWGTSTWDGVGSRWGF